MKAGLPQFLLQDMPMDRHDLNMSFLVRRRQRESMRVHGSVSRHAIALVLETIETGTLERVAKGVPESRVRDSAKHLSEHPPLLVETTTSDELRPCASTDEASPRVSESWRVRAASKAYGAIAPERAPGVTPRCSRRC